MLWALTWRNVRRINECDLPAVGGIRRDASQSEAGNNPRTSVDLYIGCFVDRAPFLEFPPNEGAEIGRRARVRHGTELGNRILHLGRLEAIVERRIEPI